MQQQREQQGSQLAASFAWVVLGLDCLAMPLRVILHRRIGSRYVDLRGVLAILLILFVALGYPGHNLVPLMGFLGLYLAMCLVNRVSGICRRAKGEEGHSRYDGTPWLCSLFPSLDEMTIKHYVEPMLVFSVGLLLQTLNAPLGMYLLLAASASCFSNLITEMQHHARIQDMRDALLEQRYLAERVRESGGIL